MKNEREWSQKTEPRHGHIGFGTITVTVCTIILTLANGDFLQANKQVNN